MVESLFHLFHKYVELCVLSFPGVLMDIQRNSLIEKFQLLITCSGELSTECGMSKVVVCITKMAKHKLL